MQTIEPGDVKPGDTIRIVTNDRGATRTAEGVVGRVMDHYGKTAITPEEGSIGRLDRLPAPDCLIYLLDRPKPAPKQLADMQPGLVTDVLGTSWVFDGAYAYRRRPMTGGTERCPVDEGKNLAPWKQEATLDYSTDGQPHAQPAPEPFKWGTEDPDGQRIYIGKTPDGTMHLGIGLASAQLRGSMAADLAKALTDMAGEA